MKELNVIDLTNDEWRGIVEAETTIYFVVRDNAISNQWRLFDKEEYRTKVAQLPITPDGLDCVTFFTGTDDTFHVFREWHNQIDYDFTGSISVWCYAKPYITEVGFVEIRETHWRFNQNRYIHHYSYYDDGVFWKLVKDHRDSEYRQSQLDQLDECN